MRVDVIVSGREAAAPPAPPQTLARAVAALRDHTVQGGGVLNLTSEFIDPACGSAVRLHLPLFQRQVAVAASEVERVEAYSPEWLARQYPSQVLRGDEVLLTSVELIVLNRSGGHSLEHAYAQGLLLRLRSPRQLPDVALESDALATARRRLS
jgi:hypothetical protein